MQPALFTAGVPNISSLFSFDRVPIVGLEEQLIEEKRRPTLTYLALPTSLNVDAATMMLCDQDIGDESVQSFFHDMSTTRTRDLEYLEMEHHELLERFSTEQEVRRRIIDDFLFQFMFSLICAITTTFYSTTLPTTS